MARNICQRMADGESLRKICQTSGFPPESTVRTWALDDIDGFAAHYTRAREIQAHTLAEQVIDIADDGTNDVRIDGDGREVANHDHIARARLRVDARKWYISKVLPKVYGDKVQHTGADGDGPVVSEVVYRWADAKTEEPSK